MRNLKNLTIEVLKDSRLRMDEKSATELVNSIWEMPDPGKRGGKKKNASVNNKMYARARAYVVTTAKPLTDLKKLFHIIKSMNMKIAVCTTDDHEATEITLKSLGVFNHVDAILGRRFCCCCFFFFY